MTASPEAAASTFAGALDKLYAATIEPAAWEPALRALADLLSADAVGLTVVADLTRRRVLALGWERPDRCPRAADVPGSSGERRDPPAAGAADLMTGRFGCGDDLAGTLSVALPPDRDHGDEGRRQTLDRLLPHVARAVAIACRIRTASDRTANAGALLDVLSTAVLVVDAHRRVLHVNQAARVMLARGEAFSTDDGRLASVDRRIDQALDHAVGGPAKDQKRRKAVAVALSMPGAPTSVCRVVPLATGVPHHDHRPCAAIFVTAPGTDHAAPFDVLAEVHALTRAERQVLEAIAAGHPPQDAAEMLGVSVSTVRTHLHRLFDKTGARRQSDLVRLVRLFSLP